MAKLADAIGKLRVGSGFSVGLPQQAACGNEGDAVVVQPIKAGDDRHALTTDRHEPVVSHLDARFGSQCEGQNLACGDVPRVVWLRELGDGEPISTGNNINQVLGLAADWYGRWSCYAKPPNNTAMVNTPLHGTAESTKGNVLLFDGHVELLKTEEMQANNKQLFTYKK